MVSIDLVRGCVEVVSSCRAEEGSAGLGACISYVWIDSCSARESRRRSFYSFVWCFTLAKSAVRL